MINMARPYRIFHYVFVIFVGNILSTIFSYSANFSALKKTNCIFFFLYIASFQEPNTSFKQNAGVCFNRCQSDIIITIKELLKMLSVY